MLIIVAAAAQASSDPTCRLTFIYCNLAFKILYKVMQEYLLTAIRLCRGSAINLCRVEEVRNLSQKNNDCSWHQSVPCS